ncbi:Hypothetical predicted protein [Paramuricea clavata]|uniref:Uncharacterized protein n=1 Tax=Paramuricea clavata TaxID=317549 RepID=A0A7D9DU34_PARCT|nr:Hypothetical predicted protein [Paramuricea clavata]
MAKFHDLATLTTRKRIAKNPALENPNQEGISVPAEMMECERKPRIILQGGMYTGLECGDPEEFMDALKGATRNGYDVLRMTSAALPDIQLNTRQNCL